VPSELDALRAERLRVVLDMARGMPTLTEEEAAALTRLTPWGQTVAAGVEEDDLALASAVMTVENELREEGWNALEQLVAAVAGMHGDLDTRVLALDGAEFVNAASALLTLGWLDYH
jgi:hypothetical protein